MARVASSSAVHRSESLVNIGAIKRSTRDGMQVKRAMAKRSRNGNA